MVNFNLGRFVGHLLPGSIFIGFASFFLLLALKRGRNLPPNNNKTFCELHVPERDRKILRSFGNTIMCLTAVGMIVEATGGVITFGNPFFQLMHIEMYFSFFAVGMISVLESKRLVPPDTVRLALGIVTLLSGLIAYGHAAMKTTMAGQETHFIWCYQYFVTGATFLYSVKYPSSLFGYILGYSMLLLLGVWTITLASQICCFEYTAHFVPTVYGMETVALLGSIVAVAVIFLPKPENENLEDTEDYELLKTTVTVAEGDSEEDEEMM